MVRAEWLAAATQLADALLFNVSTTAAIQSLDIAARKESVWNPDAGGSVAFLISGIFVVVAYTHLMSAWQPTDRAWWSAQINFMGCVAFGLSAIGSSITPTGGIDDNSMSSYGTLIGALCFFTASLIALPRWLSM